MDDSTDLYELLQVSPRADTDTIHRVFRHLAKRFHPDNGESGNAQRFAALMEAFRVLSNPVERAKYDAHYEQAREARWRIFDQTTAVDDIAADRSVRRAILAALYTARRNDAERPGIGIVHLERLLGCPDEHLQFHIWYLRENGWVERLENGTLAITASGVDRVFELGGPPRDGPYKLPPGGDTGGSVSGANGQNP